MREEEEEEFKMSGQGNIIKIIKKKVNFEIKIHYY